MYIIDHVYYYINIILYFKFFSDLPIFATFMIILAFKISILNFTPLKMVTSIYIYCKQCILTKFTTKKLLLFEFQVWASVAAFLAFSTLKFQTNAKTSLKPSSKHIHAKKILKSDISLCLAFDLAFPTFIGLFQFFCGLWSIISPVLRSNDINNPFII